MSGEFVVVRLQGNLTAYWSKYEYTHDLEVSTSIQNAGTD